MTRPRTPTLLAMSMAIALAAPSARAQMAVIDAKAILQAEQQVSNQLTAIQRLEAQLSNQAAMLQKSQADITAPLAQITGQATQILTQAQGVGYGAQNVAEQYASLYPATMPGASLAATQAALATWRQNNGLALQQALQLQNQVAQSQSLTTAQVQSAVQASQAANQLLATVTGQLTQLQALLITQARTEAVLAAQTQADKAAAAADSQRFWALTPPVSRVQNPGQL